MKSAVGSDSGGGDDDSSNTRDSRDGEKRVSLAQSVPADPVTHDISRKRVALELRSDMDFSTYLNQKRAILILTELLKRKTWKTHFRTRRLSIDAMPVSDRSVFRAGVECSYITSQWRKTRVVHHPRTMELIAATSDFGVRFWRVATLTRG